jgi:hypothetical protein
VPVLTREIQVKSYQIIDFGRLLAGVDLPDPKPTGDEVVIAVKAAGVCHSDLHLWEGGFDLGGGRRFTLKDRRFSSMSTTTAPLPPNAFRIETHIRQSPPAPITSTSSSPCDRERLRRSGRCPAGGTSCGHLG